jgi:hypothetical protein
VNVDTANNFSQIYQFNNVDKVQLKELLIPVLLTYDLNKIISLQAGPQFGIVMDNNKSFVENGKDAFKSGNFSLVGGVELHLLKFRIYGRYVGGLTDLNNIEDADTWKASAIQLGVGIGL